MTDDATITEKHRRLALVQERGLAELRELAANLHARRKPPVEILTALLDRGRLLASATGYRLHGMMPLVRELPGLARWNPEIEAEQLESTWRQRALELAGFLQRNAGEPAAERIVRAAEETLLNDLENWGET